MNSNSDEDHIMQKRGAVLMAIKLHIDYRPFSSKTHTHIYVWKY